MYKPRRDNFCDHQRGHKANEYCRCWELSATEDVLRCGVKHFLVKEGQCPEDAETKYIQPFCRIQRLLSHLWAELTKEFLDSIAHGLRLIEIRSPGLIPSSKNLIAGCFSRHCRREKADARAGEGRDDVNNISCPFHRCNEQHKISIANFDYLPQETENNGCPQNKDYINFILKRNYVGNFCWVEFTQN